VTVERVSWRAIGTNVDLLVSGGSLGAARTAVEAVIDEADRAYSRFRPDSELSRLTEVAARGVEVSPTLARAIEAGLRGARLTEGLVDPTLGRVLRLAGYDTDFANLADRADRVAVSVEAVPGWRAISWDPGRRRLRTPRGVELDFGSTGKALIVDVATEAAHAAAGRESGILVSIGGDIAVLGPPPERGWRVLLSEDSATPPSTGGEVAVLQDGALATSSTLVRRWRRDGKGLHHLIDPRTGRPAAGPWRTASVVAASCVDANIAATAAIVLGRRAAAWLAATGLPARLVSADDEVVRLGGWPALPEADHGGAPVPSPDRQHRHPRLAAATSIH
jgi:thiamine biosynthesis lipoprotein